MYIYIVWFISSTPVLLAVLHGMSTMTLSTNPSPLR